MAALGYAQGTWGMRQVGMDMGQSGEQSKEGAPERLGHLKALLQSDPTNARLARECVDLALASGDYDFVLNRTTRVLESSPQDAHAAFDRASALIGKRDYASAIEALRALLEHQPALAAARVNLGLCHYARKEYGSARIALMEAYKAGDRSADVVRLLVSSCHCLGLMDEAVALANENPRPTPMGAGVAGVYALAYLDANSMPQAAKWAARALAANPDSIDGLVVQGTVNAARMHVAHAREDFERALQLDSRNGRAWIGLGTLALMDRDFKLAQSHLRRGLEALPDHIGSWHVLAWAHVMCSELDAAGEIFERTLEMNRNFAETHGGLASVAALRGQTQAAERAIATALRLDANCLSARFAQSVLLTRAGDPQAGRTLVRTTLTGLSPQDGSLLSRIIEQAARQ